MTIYFLAGILIMDAGIKSRIDLVMGSHECKEKRGASYLAGRGEMALYGGNCDMGRMYICLAPSGRYVLELTYYPRQNLFLSSRFDAEEGGFVYTDSPFTPFMMGTLDFWKREDFFPDPDQEEVSSIIWDRVGVCLTYVMADGQPAEAAAFMKTMPDILKDLDFDIDGMEPPEPSQKAKGIMFNGYLDEISDSMGGIQEHIGEEGRELAESIMAQAASDMVDAPKMVRCVRFMRDYMDSRGIPYMTPERQRQLLDEVSMRLSMLNMEVMIDMIDRHDPMLPE